MMDMIYEDGAESLFLYTKGTKGNPPEELRQLLQYMENSSEQNAQTDGLKALHKMVTAVKHDGEVGFVYMKSFEREQRIKAASKAEGIELGKEEGIKTLVETCQEFGLTQAETVTRIINKFSISHDDGIKCVQRYWQ